MERETAATDAVPLFVRLPAATAGKLTQVASDLGTSKKNVITALVAGYAPPPGVGRAEFFPADPPEVLTAAEAAELLRVDVAVVEQLAASHELPGRRVGDSWRFSRAAILRWLDHHGEPPAHS
ncbi:MAG TPA: helix-turn-helix domain-containing protein [Candidatus Dormibacteraeota bacterium]|jgi:excisionase family DNA binding protein|nr:helix-turn-helix domain-containing protein [Candidatus Dormibacteraeota bacterium]